MPWLRDIAATAAAITLITSTIAAPVSLAEPTGLDLPAIPTDEPAGQGRQAARMPRRIDVSSLRESNTDAVEEPDLSSLESDITARILESGGVSGERYARIVDEIGRRRKELSASNRELRGLADAYEIADAEAEATRGLIAAKRTQIAQSERELSDAEEALARDRESLARTMASEYKAGHDDGALGFVLGSRDLNELASRMAAVDSISEYKGRKIAEIRDRRDDIDKRRAQLSSDRLVLSSMEDQLGAQSDAIDRAREDYERRARELAGNIDLLVGEAAEEQARYVREAIAALVASERATPVPGDGKPLPGAVETELRTRIVTSALSCVGAPYVWGGESWEEGGFDCSGLCVYAYGKNGISITRVAQDQYDSTKHVTARQLRPGDLCFYGRTTSSITHVVMYVGGGKVVEAPNFHQYVKVRELTDYGRIPVGYSSPLATLGA